MYIAIFVCFSTKAIHLELVSNLTTEAFIAALTRFVSRRGIPKEIWSHNGSNFFGASQKLEKLYEFFQKNYNIFSDHFSLKGCTWKLIPSHSPTFGGLWEAGVKSVKKHLKRILSDALCTYEQYETCLTQIAAF